MAIFTLRRYIDASGSEVLTDWLKSLNDRQARARIDARLLRLQAGNFGDCKPVRDGIGIANGLGTGVSGLF